MKATEKFKPGDSAVIGSRFLNTDLFGRTCRVIAVGDAVDGNQVYPHGIVSLKLPEGTRWPTDEVYIGPEDLVACVPGGWPPPLDEIEGSQPS